MPMQHLQRCPSGLMIMIMCLYLLCQDFYFDCILRSKAGKFQTTAKSQGLDSFWKEDFFMKSYISMSKLGLYMGGGSVQQPYIPWRQKGRHIRGSSHKRMRGDHQPSSGIFPNRPLPGICSILVTTHIFSSKSPVA